MLASRHLLRGRGIVVAGTDTGLTLSGEDWYNKTPNVFNKGKEILMIDQ